MDKEKLIEELSKLSKEINIFFKSKDKTHGVAILALLTVAQTYLKMDGITKEDCDSVSIRQLSKMLFSAMMEDKNDPTP